MCFLLLYLPGTIKLFRLIYYLLFIINYLLFTIILNVKPKPVATDEFFLSIGDVCLVTIGDHFWTGDHWLKGIALEISVWLHLFFLHFTNVDGPRNYFS